MTALDPVERVEEQAIPPAVAMVMSALEAGAEANADRRAIERNSYRMPANLKLFSDAAPTPPWLLYTRDINRRSLGFVTAHRLPLGYGGVIELTTPQGETVQVHCTLLRCRLAAPGWYEGCLYFNREQSAFDFE
jgi:hypothetical protein